MSDGTTFGGRVARRAAAIMAGAGVLFAGAALAQDKPPPAVVVKEEGGATSISFAIEKVDRVKAPDGTPALVIWFGGRWNGRDTRAGMSLLINWQPSKVKSATPSWLTDVGFARLGPESDALVQELARALRVTSTAKAMRGDAFFVAQQAGAPPRADAARYDLKLLHPAGPEGGYAEAYVRVALDGGRLTLEEKDPRYRAPLVRVLTETRLAAPAPEPGK